MKSNIKRWTIVITTLLTSFLLIVFDFKHSNHEYIVHSFYFIVIMTTFWEKKWLIFVLSYLVLSHISIDFFANGHFHRTVFLESFILIVITITLYVVLKINDQNAKKNERILNSSNTGIAHHKMIYDADGNPIDYVFLYINQKFEEITSLKSKDIIGKSVLTILPETEKHWIDTYGMVAKTLESLSFSNYSAAFDKWFEVSVYAPTKGEFVTVFSDVTEIKHAEVLAKENEERFKQMTKQSNTIIYEMSPEGLYTYISPNVHEVLGFQADEIIHKKYFFDLIPIAYEAMYKERIFQAMSEKTSIENLINPLETKQKEIKWMNSFVSPILDGNGNLIALRGSDMDVTKNKLRDDALKEERIRYARVIEATQVGTWELRIQTGKKVINRRWADIIGYTYAEIKELELKDTLTMVHPDDMDLLNQTLDQVFKKEIEFYEIEYRMKHKKGHWVWILDKGKVIEWSVYGEPLLMSGFHSDITSKKQAEFDLVIFKTISDQSNYGNALSDLEGTLVYCNLAFSKMHGYDEEELLGKNLSIVHNDEQMPLVHKLIHQMKEKGRFDTTEVWHMKKDGSVFPSLMTGKLIYEKNEPKYFSATLIDISQQKQLEESRILSEQRYRAVSQLSNTGVWEYHMEYNYLWCSPEYFKMLGYNPADMPDEPNNLKKVWEDLIHPDDLKHAVETFRYFLELKVNQMYENQYRLKHANGSYRWIWSRGNFMFLEDKKTFNSVIGTHIDVTEQKIKEEEIKYISYHDYVTSIPNRRYFTEQFTKLNQPVYHPIGVMIMDINGLKLINDAFGHGQGNVALRKVADILKEVKGPNDVIARMGGDEFAMICPNTTPDEIKIINAKIHYLLSLIEIQGIKYSVSIGSCLKEVSKTMNASLKSAEEEMYKKKVLEGQSMRHHAIMSILAALTEKFSVEKMHSEKVSYYCKLIGKHLRLSSEDLKELGMAGMLHDIGKISVPDAILSKPGKLTEEEWVIMKEHTIYGYNILKAADEYSNLALYALTHHERIDGKGYPKGLKDEEIPLFSRIICVVDAFEAMTADRPYRKAMSQADAIIELKKHAGAQFDEKIVDILINKVLKTN